MFAAHTIRPETELDEVPKWESRKRELKEQVESLEHELGVAKQKRKETPHHLKWEELPEPSKFERLSPIRKHLTHTVEMIAYRAETSMMQIVRESLTREDDSRSVAKCTALPFPTQITRQEWFWQIHAGGGTLGATGLTNGHDPD